MSEGRMNGKYLLKLNFSKEAFWQKVNLKLNSEVVQKYGLAARRAMEFPLELIRRALTTKSSTISVYHEASTFHQTHRFL